MSIRLSKPSATRVPLFRGGPACAGFTLIEMLLALAVSAIVLAGIGGVFYSAVRLRERTAALVDESAPLYQAFAVMRRDLINATGPGGVTQGDFKSGNISSGTVQGYGLQFFTTTGVLKQDVPWGDVQQVTYELRDPSQRGNVRGKELIRSVARNILSATMPDSDDQFLLGNVQKMEVGCYDGSEWRDWDTSAGDSNLPVAVRIRLDMVPDKPARALNQQPIEMVFPVQTLSRTNSSTITTALGSP